MSTQPPATQPGPESTTATLPVAVGMTRQRASFVFGPSFDRLFLTTYDDRAELDHRPLTWLGLAADPGIGDALTWAVGRLATDPGLELVVELPRDAALSEELGAALRSSAVRVADVRRVGDQPCVVLAEGEPDPALLDRLLATAVDTPDVLRTDLEHRAADWELAAQRLRTDTLEHQLRETRIALGRQRGEVRDLHLLAERHDLLPGDRLRARRHKSAIVEILEQDRVTHGRPPAPAPGSLDRVGGLLGATGARGKQATLLLLGGLALLALLTVVAVVALVVDGGAVGVGLALALVLLLGLLGVGVAQVRWLRRVLDQARQSEALLVDQMSGVEMMHADLMHAVDALPTAAPATADDLAAVAAGSGARSDAVATLFRLAPPVGTTPALPGPAAALALLAVEELLRLRPATALVAGDPATALFLALAARAHGLPTRLVVLDDDAARARSLTDALARHGVADRVEVRHAPLGRSTVEGHTTPWYSPAAWDDLTEVGLAVAGGPSPLLGPDARYPLVPALGDRLAASATVLLPDGSDGSESLTDRWSTLLPGAAVSLEAGTTAYRR